MHCKNLINAPQSDNVHIYEFLKLELHNFSRLRYATVGSYIFDKVLIKIKRSLLTRTLRNRLTCKTQQPIQCKLTNFAALKRWKGEKYKDRISIGTLYHFKK